jgi:hypothetical protein
MTLAEKFQDLDFFYEEMQDGDITSIEGYQNSFGYAKLRITFSDKSRILVDADPMIEVDCQSKRRFDPSTLDCTVEGEYPKYIADVLVGKQGFDANAPKRSRLSKPEPPAKKPRKKASKE